jgi:folate-binding protein YgfZ
MHESIIKPSEIAVIELSYLSTARFTGDECGSFLQSQLSADIEALESGDSTFSCFCTPKGKVLGLLMIGRLGDDYIACAHSDLLPGILARLKIFVFRTRVDFALDPDTRVFGMMGVETESATFRPGIGDLAYTFSKKTREISDDPDSWKARELEQGVTWLNEGSSDSFIPQMLGFDTIGAVSFSKGCYPGQEIVARARYLGKVKRKPLVIRVEDETRISGGQTVQFLRGGNWVDGTVVDSVLYPAGKTTLFAVIREDPKAAVEQLRIGEFDYRCATI